MVEELLVALAEAFAVVAECGRRDGRVAVARVRGEGRRVTIFNIVLGGLKAVMDALVVDLNGGRWWAVGDRLRMRASGKQRGGGEKDNSERFLHGWLLSAIAHVSIDTRKN